MKIWNGLSATREDALVRKGPDGEDWKTITRQLQATQEFVANLAANADVMPSLVADIKAKHNQLCSLQASIAQLTVPENVKTQVDQLEERLVKLRDIYEHAAEVLQTVNFLQQQLLNLGKRIDDHIEKSNRRLLAFENRIANWQRSNEERWNTRLNSAEEQLGAISLALGIKKFGE